MALTRFVGVFTEWRKKKVGGKLLPTHKKTNSVQGERPPQNRVSSLSKRNRQLVPSGYNPPPHPIHAHFTAEYLGTPISPSTPPDPTDRPLTPIPEAVVFPPEPDFRKSRLFKLLNAEPETSTCAICLEVRDMSEFPQRPPTDKCLHGPGACRPCIVSSITYSLQAHFWTDIRCPTCSEQLEYKDVAEYANEEAFTKYAPPSPSLSSFNGANTHPDMTTSLSKPNSPKSQLLDIVSHQAVHLDKSTRQPPPPRLEKRLWSH